MCKCGSKVTSMEYRREGIADNEKEKKVEADANFHNKSIRAISHKNIHNFVQIYFHVHMLSTLFVCVCVCLRIRYMQSR